MNNWWKGVVTTIALIIFPSAAKALDKCYMGSWKIIDRVYTGLDIQVFEDGRIAGFWYKLDAGDKLPSWFHFLGQFDHGFTQISPIADFDVNLVCKTSEMWEPHEATIETAGVGYLYIDPYNTDRMIFSWGLWTASDGTPCVGTCEGSFELERVTQHFDCGSN